MSTLYQLLCYRNDGTEWINLELSTKEYKVKELEEFIEQVHIEYYDEIYQIDMFSHEFLLEAGYFSILIYYNITYKFFKAVIKKYNIFILNKLLIKYHIIKNHYFILLNIKKRKIL